jgi:hypothetical protein
VYTHYYYAPFMLVLIGNDYSGFFDGLSIKAT